MSTSLKIKAFSGKDNKEFQKHFKAVKFCLENELSFPKETSEFFKGKVDGNDLEDLKSEYILKYLENGIEVPLEFEEKYDFYYRIKVSKIPSHVDEIIVSLEY